MFKHLTVISLAALLLALAFVVMGSPAGATNEGMVVVKVSLSEFRVDASQTTIPAGVPVRFEITNNGLIEHELVLERAGAVDEALEADLGGEEPLEAEAEHIAPGTSKTLIWTIDEPGKYQIACHVPGHFEAGMVMALTVTAAPANTGNPIHMSAPVFIAKGKGGVLVHNFYSKELTFTMNDQEYQIPANSDLFISAEDGTYTYSANVFGADDTERSGEVDVATQELSELSFFR